MIFWTEIRCVKQEEGTDGGEPGKMRREDGIGYLISEFNIIIDN